MIWHMLSAVVYKVKCRSLYPPRLPVCFVLLVVADDPESLSESDLKVISVEVDVNFVLVALLTGVIFLRGEGFKFRLPYVIVL